MNRQLEEPEVDSINTLTTRSRHSSAHGPYPIPKGSAFPVCNSVSSPYGSAESYSRSLLASGNGFPIFNVVGDWSRSPLHLKRGPCIGDVGVLTHDGNFTLSFNIFSTPDDPVHANETPPNFEPLAAPGEAEVTRMPDHFSPGTVIASKGITVTHNADPPMNFTVLTSVREGGILVLPDGASREDYVPTPSLWKYIENNAASWYSYVYYNLRGSAQIFANGSLYLVTGCDKTQSLSCVSIPKTSQSAGADVELRYSGDAAQPWWSNQTAKIRRFGKERNPGAWYAVFIRGIRIGLSHRAWASNLAVMPQNLRPYYNVLSTPIMGKWARIVRRFELRYGPRSTSLSGRWEVAMHVSDIIVQVILTKSSNVTVVVVDDTTWISQVDPVCGDGTRREISSLLVRVFLTHDIVETDGLAKLVLKTKPNDDELHNGVLRRLFTGIRDAFDQRRIEWSIRKVMDDR